jgi:DNA-directed RNA polymerase I and III subunit RPAC1
MAKSKSKEKKEVKNTSTSIKDRASVKLHGVDNAEGFEHPATFAANTKEMDPSSLKHFAQNCDIDIKKLNDEEIVFDLIGAEVPLANALRRIMISEIATIAIEKVTMW